MFREKLISLTLKLINFKSKLKPFILIDLFKVYFNLKLIPLRSNLIYLTSKLNFLIFGRAAVFIFKFLAFGPAHIDDLMRPSRPSFCVL